MRKKTIKTLALVALTIGVLMPTSLIANKLPHGFESGDRVKTSLNKGWKFKLGNPDAQYFKKDTDDSAWEKVNVPHTLKLTSLDLDGCQDDKTQPTFHRDVGWYRKDIKVGDSSKKVFIDFEGSHQVTTLWVNGNKVGTYGVGGYTPFIFDITDYVKPNSQNQITILADNRRSEFVSPDAGPFDYVKFSGLYRDLYLVETNQIHISSNLNSMDSGITITTPSIDTANGNATVDIRTEVVNDSDKAEEITLLTRVIDANGNVVLKLEDTQKIPANSSYRFAQIGGMEDDVRFWSVEDPYLYKVNSSVIVKSDVIDVKTNPLGLRRFEKTVDGSFLLNGKPILLVGFNRHQHYAYIGDAMPDSLHRKDIIQLKRLGMNILRTAHYPQDNALIQAADELGMLIYEEPPTWIDMRGPKEWFEGVKNAARAMVRNHKNHPSVIMWGGGINHRGYVPEFHFTVKQEDPTRLTASQSSRWTGWQTSGMTDVYGNMMYGPGIWERQEPLLAMEGNFGPEVMAEYHRDPMKTGMIAWTAHAYYTFHIASYGVREQKITDRTRLGVLTSMRYLKEDMLMWYPAEYTNLPYMYIPTQWTKDIDVLTVYSNAQKVELILNGKSLGEFIPSRALKYQGLNHPPFEIKIDNYKEGKLEVIGYVDDQKYCQETIYTPKKASDIRLIADDSERTFVADGSDIMVVHAEIIDENGTIIKDYDGSVKLSISGEGTIVGDDDFVKSNPCLVANGATSFLIKSTNKAGKITLSTKADGIESDDDLVIQTSKAPSCDMIAREAYPIYDTDVLRVDIGGENQLPQFGWQRWIGEGNTSTWEKDGVKFTLKSNSEDGVIRWLGEMNVIGKYGFVYGDGALVFSKDGAILNIAGLPKGNYTLNTYHHAPSSNTNSMDPNLEKLAKESIHKLPYFKEVLISKNGKQADIVKITAGKEMQFEPVAISTIKFKVKDASKAVEIKFEGQDGKGGIWINGFELIRQK